MVANVLEKNASSLCSSKSPTMRSDTPEATTESLSLSMAVYSASIDPNLLRIVVAVFSPIPGTPIILSEASPLNPL